MSRLKIDIDDELDFDLEEGDIVIHIKSNGDVGKVYMPDMNLKVKESTGYRKFLECIDILKPGTSKEFIKHYEIERKGKLN